MYESVLNRKKWTNCETPEMKVVSSLAERTEFPAAGAPLSHTLQLLTARIIRVVSAIDRSVDIKPAIEISGIKAASSGVYVNIAGRLKIGRGISIATR